MRRQLAILLSLALLCVPLAAPAHHSTANFDMKQTVALTGTVKYFAFTNPHSYFDLDVTEKGGAIKQYKIFTVAKVVMTRTGWEAMDLKPGDKVTLTGSPDRKTPTYLYLANITFANGKTWSRDKIY